MTTNAHPIASPEQWWDAHQRMRAKEKEVMRARDALAAERRRMPWMAVGRQEDWEDSPPGHPRTPPYTWWRWHDSYDAEPS